jgi:hypothetical protein
MLLVAPKLKDSRNSELEKAKEGKGAQVTLTSPKNKSMREHFRAQTHK